MINLKFKCVDSDEENNEVEFSLVCEKCDVPVMQYLKCYK